jgi:dynein heavy chain
VENFRKNFLATLPFSYNERMTIDEINDSYRVIMEYYNKLVAMEQKAHDYNNLERLFELQKSNYK